MCLLLGYKYFNKKCIYYLNKVNKLQNLVQMNLMISGLKKIKCLDTVKSKPHAFFSVHLIFYV